MKIVIATDSYKESLTSIEVANAIESGFKTVYPYAKYLKIPVADGGEGTVNALVEANNGEIIKAIVKNPLGKDIESYYGILEDKKTAVIEMATACGLALLKEEEKNPFNTSTFGFGQLILDALDKNITNFILALGGSSTNDGGVGMLQALGVKFLNQNRKEIGFGARFLKEMVSIDTSSLDKRLKNCSIKVACDVNNILCGENGASFVFGKQKGANQKMIKELDDSLNHYSNICETTFERKTKNIKGSGAAGGLGFALITFLNASLLSGADIVLNRINFNEQIKDANLVITGEGRMDSQTSQGKIPIIIAKRAKKYNIPVIAICGAIGEDYEKVYQYGIDAVFDCVPTIDTLDNILINAKENIKSTSRNIAKVLKM